MTRRHRTAQAGNTGRLLTLLTSVECFNGSATARSASRWTSYSHVPAWHARGGRDQSRGGTPKGDGTAAREADVISAADSWARPVSMQVAGRQRAMTPVRSAARRLPKLLLILHASNGFNNLGHLLFAQS
jgi:hypothetical protein